MGTACTSFVLQGIDASRCVIEADVSHTSLPRTTIVGLPDMAVRESSERVRIALANSGFSYPFGRVTVNLAPADLRKEGPVYDLPIALSILRAGGLLSKEACARLDRCMVAGELALDGSLRPVRGVVSMGVLARKSDIRNIIVPSENAAEAGLVNGVSAWSAASLHDVVAHLSGVDRLRPVDLDHPPVTPAGPTSESVDLGDIRGQAAAKRALVIAAAGRHNLLMVGPPGCGKTMLARALPGLLPAMTKEEVLELAQVRSCAGRGLDHEVGTTRPVRAPHHTASAPSLVGGGTLPRPGEVSLAHHGVLFLDELPEFTRAALEALREPLQDRMVTVSRVHSTVRFPASFLLVAAANPCPGARGIERISGPLIDRIDLHVELEPVSVRTLRCRDRTPADSSATIRCLVQRAVDRATARQGDVPNGMLQGDRLEQSARMTSEAEDFLYEILQQNAWSMRAWDSLRRIARTICDLDDSDVIGRTHVVEATGYRRFDQAVR